MASKLPHCDICSLRGILEPATVWCSECDESICSECKQHHGLCKATRSHRTLPIEDFLKLPAFVREFNLRCEEHDEKLELFCSIHAVPCCLKCVKLKHEKCRDIKPFHATEQPIKSSASFSDLKSICIELDDYYQGIEIKLEQIKSIKLLDNQALEIMNTVKDMKKDVLKHLDDLEQKAIDDIPKKKEQLAESIVKFTTAINGRWGRVKNFLTQLQRIEQHAQEHKILHGLHKLEKEIQSENSFIQYFKGNPGLIQFGMEFVPSIDFTTSFKLGKINIMSDLMIPAHNTFDNETLEHIQAELPTVYFVN
ncbi:E3 ubiquitin-protein ligase TRIM71-like [Mytilus edulis]|uniref:E3 ubiquitin-protein ligase TRIM71-like n=1 Tax=Mytilus edulis TaxID=6550 RepID=UPI0039F0AEB5